MIGLNQLHFSVGGVVGVFFNAVSNARQPCKILKTLMSSSFLPFAAACFFTFVCMSLVLRLKYLGLPGKFKTMLLARLPLFAQAMAFN